MKIKDQNTSDPYTKIASRAKLCLEAEQRRKIGGWITRVLVIDKATLFTYRLRGDSGSVNAWGIGGSEVGARKARKDGRYVVTVVRHDAYSLLFALNTLDEQAAFIHALSSSGSTIVGIYGILLLKEYIEVQKAIKMSLEKKESYGYPNLVYRKNSPNFISPKRALEIPELSSRMTEVTWTFNNTSNCPQKAETVTDNRLIDDIIHRPPKDISCELSPKISSRFERKQEYQYSFPCNSTLSMTSKDLPDNIFIPYKKPLTRVTATDTLKIIPMVNESPRNNSSLMVKSEGICFMPDEPGKVSKIREMFESQQMNEMSEASRTHLKNKELGIETLRRVGSVDCVDSKFIAKDRKKSDKNQLYAKSKSMEESYYRREADVGIAREGKDDINWTTDIRSLRKKLDQRDVTSSLVGDNDSEVILSAILKVAQSASGKCHPTKVELIRGHLVLMATVQQQRERRVTNYRSGNPIGAASQSVVKLGLEGVSTIPLNQESRSILILKRKSKVLLIIQIDSPDDLATWVRAISEEIIAVTPLTKRNSLIIYPGSSSTGGQFPFEICPKEEEIHWSINRSTKNEDLKWKSGWSADDLSSTFKDSKEPENRSKVEIVFKGLRRKFGIRRQSRDIDKQTVENHPVQYFHMLPESNEDAYAKVKNTEIRINVPAQTSEFFIEKPTFTSKVNLFVSRHRSEVPRENDGLEHVAKNNFIPDATRESAIISSSNITSSTKNEQLRREKNQNKNKETVSTEIHRNITEWPFKFGSSAKISKTFVQDAIKTFDESVSASLLQLIKQSSNDDKDITKNEVKKIWEEESQPILKGNRKTEKHRSFLCAKKFFVASLQTTDRTEENQINESREEDVVEGTSISIQSSENDTENNNDNANINVKWSVAALKERFEILNTVNKDKDSSCRPSWSQNSIRKRKEMRNSIRRKKTLEGESRRASIRRSTKKDYGVINLKPDENSHKQITKDEVLNQENVGNGRSIEKSIHVNPIKTFDLSDFSFSPTSETKQIKQQIPLIKITTEDEEGKWEKSNNSSQHIITDESRHAMDSSNLMRSNSLNSPRSIIVSKNRKFKSLQSTSSLRSERSAKPGKKRTNSLRDEFPNNTEIVMKNDNEGSIYEYLNNTFLAKRCLVAKEVEVARIQDALLRQEEQICEIQLKLNSLSIPKCLQNQQRRGMKEYEKLRKLEKELVTARTQYDILEDRLNEAKHKTTTIKQDMQTTIRKCLKSERQI